MTPEGMFWGSGLLVAACGFALLAWALFSDRSRGRRRCCKCWYSMDHALSLRCSECGHEARNERKLFKTRRRWRWAMASAVPLLLAAFLAVQPKVQRDGWGSVLPATVMILILRVDDRPWVIDGIQYHISHEAEGPGRVMFVVEEQYLWDWQWRLLGRTLLKRIDDEQRVDVRTTYHKWLAVVRDYGDDPRLQAACRDALIGELKQNHPRLKISASIYSVDYTDIDRSITRAVDLLSQDDLTSQRGGITALRLISHRSIKAVDALVDALKHDDPEVRSSVVAAIGSAAHYHHDGLDVAYRAVLALDGDESGRVRFWRIHTLVRMQSAADAEQTIAAALRSNDPYERDGALFAMYDMESRPLYIAAMVIELLGDETDMVRQTARGVIGDFTLEELATRKDTLRSLLGHDDVEVRNAASQALRRLADTTDVIAQ